MRNARPKLHKKPYRYPLQRNYFSSFHILINGEGSPSAQVLAFKGPPIPLSILCIVNLRKIEFEDKNEFGTEKFCNASVL